MSQTERQSLDIRGIYPPVPTFFDEREELDLPTLREHITWLKAKGIRNFVPLGSNGEALHLEPEERRAVIETVREAAGRDAQLLAGTGATSTRSTIALTKLAADAGADVALILPPHHYRSAMTPCGAARALHGGG